MAFNPLSQLCNRPLFSLALLCLWPVAAVEAGRGLSLAESYDHADTIEPYSAVETILLLHSYDHDTPWSKRLTEHIHRRLKEHDHVVEIHEEFLQYRGESSNEHIINFLAGKYSGRDAALDASKIALDLIITTRERAFYAIRDLPSSLSDTPIVYVGLHSDDSVLRQGYRNSTGLITIYPLERTFQLIKEQMPQAKKLVVVVDSLTDLSLKNEIKSLPKEGRDWFEQIRVLDSGQLTTEALLSKVASLEEDSVVLFDSWQRDILNSSVNEYWVLQDLAEQSPVAIYGLHLHHLGYGIVGGLLQDARIEANYVVDYTMQLMHGMAASSLAPQRYTDATFAFDYEALQRWGLAEVALPEGSDLINTPATAYQLDKNWFWSIVFILLGQTVVILSLLAFRYYKRQLSKKEEDYQRRLELCLEGADLGYWEWNVARNELNLNHRWKRILGQSQHAELSRMEHWLRLCHPADREKMQTLVNEARAGKSVRFETELRFWHKNGAWLWTLVKGKAVEWDNTKQGLVLAGTLMDISVRRKTEEILLRSEARLQMLFDGIDDLILMHDFEGNILDCNKSACEQLGYKRSELLSLSLQDLQWAQSEDWTEAFKLFTQTRFSYRAALRSKAGEDIQVEARNTVIDYGSEQAVLGVFRDIRKQLKIEEALQQSEGKYRTIIQSASEGIALVGMDGRISFVNPRAAELLGYDKNEMVGLHFNDLLEQEKVEGDSGNGIHQQERSLHLGRYDARMRKKGGAGIVWAQIHATPVETGHHQRAGTLVMIMDVTQRRETETYLRKAREEAEEANTELRRLNEHANQKALEALMANRAKSDFLANISHEIRTPMNSIMGLTSLMLESDLQPEQREYAEIVIRSAEGLLGIINDILDFSKIETGKLKLESIPYDLHELVRQLEKQMHFKASSKELDCRFVLHSGVPQKVMGDSLRLRQVLLNITDNAIKFTHTGRIRVDVAQQDAENPDHITFTIRDTGIGVPANKHKHLFEPFSQADSTTTRKYGGTGLGLSIVRRLVELMGGEIDFTSVEGQGSTFWFTIPLPAVVDEAEDESGGAKDLHPLFDRSFKSNGDADRPAESLILLVEDNIFNQKVALKVLQKLGYKAHTANNGVEALEMLSVDAESYKLIIMDVQMPEMDGIEATVRIRSGEAGDNLMDIPIVALTAYAMKGDKEKCLEAGMNDYLTKPLQPGLLGEVILRYVDTAVEGN